MVAVAMSRSILPEEIIGEEAEEVEDIRPNPLNNSNNNNQQLSLLQPSTAIKEKIISALFPSNSTTNTTSNDLILNIKEEPISSTPQFNESSLLKKYQPARSEPLHRHQVMSVWKPTKQDNRNTTAIPQAAIMDKVHFHFSMGIDE